MSPKIEKLKPLLNQLNLNELEELKELLINNYFQEFEKKEINEIALDLKQSGHNDKLINDIINGLKKASVYEN